jgi:uncharacterized protein YbjT (DUF2867 family)
VCGATGYIGGRLVPRLLECGYQVRCFVRKPQKLAEYPWRNHPHLEVVTGDMQDVDSIRQAAAGIGVAYYLVHSMAAAGPQYASRDAELAINFRESIAAAGVQRCVYLGGLGELGPDLSEHLRSRREVEKLLREGEVPVTSFRAAMIIGSGSASFEILRYLVDRLPIMVTPRWVQTETQPIAVRDVLRYLVECLDVPETTGTTLDIGGRGVVTYLAMMRLMAAKIGLPRRWIIPVPVLTPKLSSLWIGLVTPVNSRIARPLSEGLRNRTVCRDDRAEALMPGTLLSVEEAIDAALGKWEAGAVETRWSTAGEMPGDPAWSGGTVLQDERELRVHASAADAFSAVCQIGGSHGYWGADRLWQLRGWMDKLVGGPGLRRGRRHPLELAYGEAVDFWRVSQYETDRRLGLRAEMKLPGTAELQFVIEPLGEHDCKVTQTAKFRPRGLLGILYWYAVVPLHYFVFQYMLQGIKRAAEKRAASPR